MMLELAKFLDEAEASLASIANEIGWKNEDILKGPDMVTCPHNHAHVIPSTSFERHVEKCKLLSAGVSKDEVDAISPSSHFCYEGISSKYHVAINLDDSILSDILTNHHSAGHSGLRVKKTLPLTNDRAVSDLTQDERLAVYDYCVGEAKRQHQLTSIPKEELLVLFGQDGGDSKDAHISDGSEKSQLEKLAELRDYKRRRQTYRAKNVHTTKKSYTEIIRDVILNQMSMLTTSSSPSNRSDSKQAGTPALTTSQPNTSAGTASGSDVTQPDMSVVNNDNVTHHRAQSANDPRPTTTVSVETDAKSSYSPLTAQLATSRAASSEDEHDAAGASGGRKRRHKHRGSSGSRSRSRSRTPSRSKSHKKHKHKHKHKKAKRSSQDKAFVEPQQN